MTTPTTRDARLEPPNEAEKPPAPCGMPHELSEYAWRVAARERQLQRIRRERWKPLASFISTNAGHPARPRMQAEPNTVG